MLLEDTMAPTNNLLCLQCIPQYNVTGTTYMMYVHHNKPASTSIKDLAKVHQFKFTVALESASEMENITVVAAFILLFCVTANGE